ncbi:formylglycine-generating enzyme family protein [Thalassomonas viridans]|uniref:Formylglycine-generating enzyme family protein n=1 Tax=Thalassomonas viridans TaxID=137584 RepID=A0AAE9Z6W2_9GAMM|nr:formylglycine-generating enzyme family protein [Thalassomonas viridans]WDE07881.1 formylglycine-generating enzyme family protein [Thalassomonas viridans]
MRHLATVCLSLITALPAAAALPQGMVKISGGPFSPFFDRDKDGNKISILVEDFYLDQAPVTNGDYLSFIRQNPQWSKTRIKRIFAEKTYLKHWPADFAFKPGEANKPVRHVSWFAASAYCQALNKQLPTIMQWEYAAIADEKRPNAMGQPGYRQQILDWYSKPSTGELADVKQGHKNYWSVYDLHGLLWEWNLDYNTALVTGESRENASLNRNMFCGSGALGAKDKLDYGAFMRFGFRSALKGNYTVGNLGFRCAQSAGKSND